MDKEEKVLNLFNKYYEYIRLTDDSEQRGELKRDFAEHIVKLFCEHKWMHPSPENGGKSMCLKCGLA